MANRNFKKAIVFALVLTMLMPLGSMAASSAEDADTAAETSDAAPAEDSGTEEKEEKNDKASKLAEKITNEQAIALDTCEKISENDKFVLYADSKHDRWGVYVKSSGNYWWSSPINVEADDTIVDVAKGGMMKSAKRKQIASSAAIKVGDLRQEKRTESPAPVYSTKGKVKYSKDNDGLVINYVYKAQGVEFTSHVVLEEDDVYVYVDTSEIVEENIDPLDGKVLTKLQLAPAFGAIGSVDESGNPTDGYMIVPDGSGAVIKYNNGKNTYAEYSQLVYGRDYTAVPLNAPRVTEQAYLPVVASVNGKKGFVAVVTDGDAFVYAKAKVSLQDNQVYNNCYFEFETKSSDSFFMSGDNSNKINVFEKGDIKTPRFGIKYFLMDKEEDINYADCAEVYRNYLVKNKGFSASTPAGKSDFYVDFFGGVLKQTSILGIPFDLKTEITGFDQAGEIISQLKDLGVDSAVVNYNDWTNNEIKRKVSTSMSPSGTLGGSNDFEDFIKTSDISVYPSINNFTMESSTWGYTTFSNTATRISNAYSRQVSYSPAFGVAINGVSPALIAPDTYTKIFDEMIEDYKDEGIDRIGFGSFANKLVSDFSTNNASSRNDTIKTLVDGYSKAKDEIGSVIADAANSYIIPYATEITNIPVYSSGFNVTDFDIPFYQMVLHGYVPYATKPINASSNTGETFMLALAAGSGIHYDMTYVEASTLKDTDFDELYYSNYEGWIDMAAKQYKISKELLADVSDMTISKYEVSEDGNIITTTYSKDGNNKVVEINKAAATAKIDGKTIDLAGAIEGGAEG
ncbi:MAG: hypothetical protein IKO27_04395 [Ruminococcus sp.]|nr:hypothetical protein [Ruminococcus sp.]